MTKNLQFFTVVIILFFTTCFSGRLYSQGLNSIVAPDNDFVIAVGDNGKILRSSNGGATWARYTIGTVNYKSASSYGDDVWLGGNDGKVYKTNKASSPVTGYTTGLSSVNGICFANSLTGYVCGNAGAVYKTTDGGLTWNLRNTGIANVKLNAISFQDDANGIAVGDNGSVYWTSTGAVSWFPQISGTTRNLLAVHYYASFQAYITGEWGVILKFTGIPTLTSIISRTTSDIRAISGTSATDIHIAGGGGFIRNNKNGSNEFLNFEINPMMANIVSMDYLNSSTGYAISSLHDVVIKTTNSGQSWQLTAGASMNISYVSKLTASGGIGNGISTNPVNRDILYVCYGRNIYRSIDRAETWAQIATIPSSLISSNGTHSFYVSPLDTNIFLAASENSPTDRVIRSTDYGTTWNVILNMNFTSYGTPLEIDHVNPAVFYYAPDGGGFYKSTNSGANFTEISGNYPFRSPCDITVAWEDPNIIFLADGITSAAQPADLFKSTNGGINWVKVHTNPGTGGNVSEIPVILNSPFDKNLMYITTWSGNLRFKSTNGGDNWFGIQSTSFSGWTGDICREDPTLVLTGNYGQNVSLSTNSGANWTEYSLPSGNCGAGTIVPSRDYLIAQQCGGLLKMKIQYSGFVSIEEQLISSNIPSKYGLYQNYPNPFNPSTEIKYDVLNTGNVLIKVYDETGKNISTLVNGIKNPGTYSVKFNASSFASGVYYYTMETNGSTFTKKMLLVK
jgi:photosystem II stability/assembly factor-like uncharacterized protein